MRIAPIQYNTIQTYKNRSYSSSQPQVSTTPVYSAAPSNFQIPFYGLVTHKAVGEISGETYKAAKDYLDSERGLCESWGGCFEKSKLTKFKLDKLNGIQEGIKVFGNMTMKEIAFVCDNLYKILIYRGCSHNCLHCLENAGNKISRMLFEDFSSLIGGIGALNERLGFNVLNNFFEDIALFRDADCLEIEMLDKAGNVYDFVDVSDLLYRVTKKTALFDTSGWNPADKKYQERAERIVKYFSVSENTDKASEINISINPFFDPKQETFDSYTTKMANVIFTFTPIIKNEKFGFSMRVMPEKYTLYNKDALNALKREILAKLRKMYEDDCSKNKIYIKNVNQISDIMGFVNGKMLTQEMEGVINSGRAEKLFGEKGSYKDMYITDPTIFNSVSLKNKQLTVGVNSNGKVYAKCGKWTVPTELAFDFEGADIYTPPLAKTLRNIVITKAKINKDY